jgi:hypothetical protein
MGFWAMVRMFFQTSLPQVHGKNQPGGGSSSRSLSECQSTEMKMESSHVTLLSHMG